MPTKLQTQTFDGAPLGTDLEDYAHEIPDGYARQIVDAWTDIPDLIVRRGPVRKHSSYTDFPDGSHILGMFQAREPNGTISIGILYELANVVKIKTFDDTMSGTGVDIVTLPSTVNWTLPYPIIDAKPCVGGGIIVGIQTRDTEEPGNKVLFWWKGARKPEYAVPAGGLSFTQGSTTVTGTSTNFTDNVVPGMFLKAHSTDNSKLSEIGVVKSVTSATSLQLETGALFGKGAADGAGYFEPIRGIGVHINSGLVTASSGDTTVTGVDTKFKTQGVGAVNTEFHLFRASDMTWVGKVKAYPDGVTNDYTIVLDAAATIDMQLDEYVLIDRKAEPSYTSPIVGFLNCQYAGLQWYANLGKVSDLFGRYTTRLWFTSGDDPEALDLAPDDGNFIEIPDTDSPDTPIKAIWPVAKGLLIFKERSVFILTGKTPSQFVVNKIWDDGTISAMTLVPYANGMIWAGRNGVYVWDGVEPINMFLKNLRTWWQGSIEDFNGATDRAWGAVVRDKYMLFSEGLKSTTPIIYGTAEQPNKPKTIVMHLPTKAVTFFNNVRFTGYATLAGETLYNVLYSVNSSDDNRPYICTFNDLFQKSGVDAFTCVGCTKGPRFFFESKKYSMGQLLQLKRLKLLLLSYASSHDLMVDIVAGFYSEAPADLTKTLPATGTGLTWDLLAAAIATWDLVPPEYATWNAVIGGLETVRKLKFMRKNQLFSFRIYEKYPGTTHHAQLANWALGWKWMRPGRV